MKPSLTKARKLTLESYLVADEAGFQEAYLNFLSDFGVNNYISFTLPVLKLYPAVVVFKTDGANVFSKGLPDWIHQGDIDFVFIPESVLLAAKMQAAISHHSVAGCSLGAMSTQIGDFIKEVNDDKRA